MIKQKFWNKILGFIKEYAYFIFPTINFLLRPKANFRLLRISQKKETADTIHSTLPVPVCLTDSLVGMLSLVPRAEWQTGTCTTGFGSPSQSQDSKAAVLSGMEARCAAKLLTQQEQGPHPGRGWAAPEVLSTLFPAQVQPWEMPSTMEGSEGSGAHRWYCAFGGEVCIPPPIFRHRAEGHSNFSLPFKGRFRGPKDIRRHLTTPVLQNRQQSGEPSVISLSPTRLCSCHQKRGQKRAVQHILSLLHYLLLWAALLFLQHSPSPLCQREHSPLEGKGMAWGGFAVGKGRKSSSSASDILAASWIKQYFFSPKLIWYLFSDSPILLWVLHSVNNVHGTHSFVPGSKQMDY